MKRIVLLVVSSMLVASLAQAEVVVQPLSGDTQRGPNRIQNAGFEELASGKPVGWNSHLAGDSVADEQAAHSGKVSLRMSKTAADTLYWVSQTVELNQTRPQPLVVAPAALARHRFEEIWEAWAAFHGLPQIAYSSPKSCPARASINNGRTVALTGTALPASSATLGPATPPLLSPLLSPILG